MTSIRTVIFSPVIISPNTQQHNNSYKCQSDLTLMYQPFLIRLVGLQKMGLYVVRLATRLTHASANTIGRFRMAQISRTLSTRIPRLERRREGHSSAAEDLPLLLLLLLLLRRWRRLKMLDMVSPKMKSLKRSSRC